MLKRIISGDKSGAGWGDLQGFPFIRQAKVGTAWVRTWKCKPTIQTIKKGENRCGPLVAMVTEDGIEPSWSQDPWDWPSPDG